MTLLRILNVIAWGGLVLFMVPGALSAMRGHSARRGDAMRLACFLTGLVMVGFNARWLLAPGNTAIWQGLYVASIGVAIYIVWLAHTYGRGPRV